MITKTKLLQRKSNQKDLTGSVTSSFNTMGYTTVNATDITAGFSPVFSKTAVSDLLEEIIKDQLVKEDTDGTLSKLITSIVIDKMYEISGMSEEELVESILYKKLSEEFKGRLESIENKLQELSIEIDRINSRDKLFNKPFNPFEHNPYDHSGIFGEINDTTIATNGINTAYAASTDSTTSVEQETSKSFKDQLVNFSKNCMNFITSRKQSKAL